MLDVRIDFRELIRLPGVMEEALRAGMGLSGDLLADETRKAAPERRGILRAGVKVLPGFPVTSVEVKAFAKPLTSGVYQSTKGDRKEITFRQRAPHDYAPDVDDGTEGPIRPVRARALLIEVDQIPAGEGFVVADGRFFIYRRSTRGQKAQRFSERAADATAPQIPAIFKQELDRR